MSRNYEMVATADTLFLAGKQHVFAISLTTHQVVWQLDKHAYQLALGAGKLFIFSGSTTETVVTAVDLN